jgi:hypothetical protein
LLAADLSPRVRSYINSLDDERLRIDLLCHIHWDCGQAELQTLQAELDDQLVQFGAKHYGLAATESKKLASRLLLEVLNTTVTASKRRLTYSGMLEIAEDFTHVSLRRRDFDNLLAAAAPVNKEVSAPVATPSEDAVGRRPLREVYPTAWSPWFSKPAHNFGLLIGLATAYPAVYWQLNHVLHHMFGITFDQLKSLSDNRTGGLAFDPYMGVCQLILMAVVLAPIANWSFRKAARSGGDTTRWYLTAAGLVLWPMAVMALLGLTRGLQSPSAAMVAAINGVVSLTLLRANLPKIINTIDEIVGQEKMKFTNDDRRLSYGCRREVEAWFQRLMYVLGIFIVVFCAMMIVLAIIPLPLFIPRKSSYYMYCLFRWRRLHLLKELYLAVFRYNVQKSILTR